MRLRSILKGIALSVASGWVIQVVALSLLRSLKGTSGSGLSAPLTLSTMALSFLFPFKGNFAKRLRDLASYLFVFSLVLLAFGLLLPLSSRANSTLLTLAISTFFASTICLFLKVLRNIRSTRTNLPNSEIVAFSNFPRPMFFREERNGMLLSYVGGIKIEGKDILEDLRSKLLSFPFSIEIKSSCPIIHFVHHVMTSELSKRVAVLARSSRGELTISAGSTEIETLYDLTGRVSRLDKSKLFVRCYIPHAKTSELVNACKGYSPPLKLSCFTVPSGLLSGRWLLVCEAHELKRMAKDIVQLGLCHLFYIKLEVASNAFLSPRFKRPILLLSSLLGIGRTYLLKFNVLLSHASNKQQSRLWDLILEHSESVPEDLKRYDGVLFIRPASEDEVVKLLPSSMSYLSKSMSGKAFAFELKSGVPSSLVGDTHGDV